MEIHIRRAVEKDSVKIAEMLKGIGKIHHDGRPDIYKDNLQKYNEEDINKILKDENTFIFVATDIEENVMGYAFCISKTVNQTNALNERKYLYIDDFCVDEALRGNHIGSVLMSEIKEQAKIMGFKSIELNVWEFNDSAIKFYEKCGFKTQKREMEIFL